MKILYVIARPLQINTSASIRNRATILGLLEIGHEVDILTSEPDKNHMAYDETMDIPGIHTQYIKITGVQSVARIGRKYKILEPLKRFCSNIYKKREIYDNLKGIIKYINVINLSKEKYDVIISSSDPKSSHLFVYSLLEQQEFLGKWIQIWGDPFLNDITLDKRSNNRLVYKEEKKLLARADIILYVSELTLKQQEETYPEYSEKMHSIPIPYEEKQISKTEEKKGSKCVQIAYCGDYRSNIRNILPLYKAMANSRSRYSLSICGNSDLSLDSNDNVKIIKRQPHEVIKRIEAESDILIHISNISGSQIPGKIYQYSSTDKPILFILDGKIDEIRTQFEKYNRYVFCKNTEDSILSALDKIVSSSKDYSPVEEFNKDNVAKMIIGYMGND